MSVKKTSDNLINKPSGGAASWNDISGKPSTFPPSAHGHSISDVTGLQTALDGKQPAGSYAAATHGHAAVDITESTTKRFVSDTEKSIWNAKQEALVSGTNIKTINNQSLLGSGNINIAASYTLVASLANDLNTAANTTLVNVSGMVFTYEANSIYRVHLYGAVSAAATTTGNGFAFDLSSAVTAVWLQHFHQLANTGTLTSGSSVADAASIGVSSGVPVANAFIPVYLTGVIRTAGNTGTAQLQFRSEVAAVATLRAGSVLVVEKIG